MSWTAQILTILPDMFPGPLGTSLAGQALSKGIWSLEVLDIRDYARNKHRAVDDSPAGGGPGMVMRVDVMAAAIDAARSRVGVDWPLVYPGPRGRRFNQSMAADWSARGGVTILCGRFEGVDERIFAARGVEEVSLGDFVLSGGEPAALVMLDAAVRLLPGVVGAPATLDEESFEQGLLEYPHYTRPRAFEGLEIPEILQSGHHGRIAQWRRMKSEETTRVRRPDLWKAYAQKRRKGMNHERD